MKKIKPKKFLLIQGTIFPFDVLITTASDKELQSYIEGKKKYKLNDEERERLIITGEAKTIQLRGGQTIVRLFPCKAKIGIDLPLLIHELQHAVYMILSRCGVEHTLASDELFSYYLSYLTKQSLLFYDP